MLFLWCGCVPIYAQLKGDHILGDFGLTAGTQAPPSVIGAVPFYWYDAAKLKDDNGDVIAKDVDIHAFLIGLGGTVVTNLKILNASYGASFLLGFMRDRIEGNKIHETNSLGFSDTYVQPLQLGWHLKQVDFTVGYALYMPTGKYEYGADDNKGMGMWTHEFSAGSTVFFDKKKSIHFSAIGFYETHSKKKDTTAKVGDIISVEGGLGKTFYKKIEGFPIPVIFNAGVIYYMQFKVSDDEIAAGSNTFPGDKDKI